MDEQHSNTSVVTATDTIIELHRYFKDTPSRQQLYQKLRPYVRRFSCVPLTEIDDETHELLQNVVLRAIEIADKYHGTGMTSWLLSIAINLLKQQRKSTAIHQKTVIHLGDLHRENHPTLSDEEFFELFTAQIALANAQESQMLQDLKEAITSLSEDSQLILNYYIHYGYNHNEIARRLDIKPGAARVRYYRAVSQLRNQLLASNENKGGENNV